MTETLQQFLDYFHVAPWPSEQTWPLEIPKVTRTDLARFLGACGTMREGAEVGVWRGAYSKELCEHNPSVHLYCVDAWRVHDAYRDVRRQDRLDESYLFAQNVVAPYHTTFIRDFSVEAAKRFAPESLDFVYIDANHRYEAVVEDLAAWIPKVRSGGVVCGHDYALLAPKLMCHVVYAVNGYMTAYGHAPWFILGRGRDAMQFKRKTKDDPHAYRSWVWIKP